MLVNDNKPSQLGSLVPYTHETSKEKLVKQLGSCCMVQRCSEKVRFTKESYMTCLR